MAIIFIAVFAVIVGASQVLSDSTNRRSFREDNFVSTQVAADAALEVMYGRFAHWVVANTGLTPSISDSTTVGVPGTSTFPAIAGAITFPTTGGLSAYTVSNISLVPLLPDDTQGTDFPNASTWSASTYQPLINKYYINIPNIYATSSYSNALAYLATVTITPKFKDSLHPSTPITLSRYFQSSQVSPFTYNIFTQGTFEDYDFGQSFDSEANIYASTKIQLDHKGTIVNGAMRYGSQFVNPDGTVGGTADLVFQDPTSGATVDPFASGLLKQVSPIEVVPDIKDVIAHNSDGSRSASAEFATATDDDFSRREIIEPPANITSGDTAPNQVAQKRIYTQADVRLKVSVSTKAVTSGSTTSYVSTATGTFYSTTGTVVGQYTGTVNSPTQTTWSATSGGNTVTAGVIAAVNVNPSTSSTPFYDPTRRYDTPGLYSGQPGQPTATNIGGSSNPTGGGIESVDVNVGKLASTINGNQSTFANNTVYIWDDGSSGQMNGVRLYNGGTLPTNGLTVGSTNPVYVKGDYNTGSVLSSSTDINASTTASQPDANTLGWDNGGMATVAQRVVGSYALKPAGIFGDTVTSLSQNWRDASSGSTQYACSTTFNAVLGFGSGDVNSLLPNDSFSNGTYSCVQSLEMWNNCRWSQLGEQMSLYHSLYNLHKNPPSWLNGGWLVIQNDFNPTSARLPLKWGYLVFSRGRYVRD